MADPATTRALERNIRLYPWYAAIFNAYFWMPVFFLYFGKHLSLEDVLKLEAVYYMGVVLLEVPSGYLSDTVGRRVTLLLAAVFLMVAYVLFIMGSTFAILAIAQVFLAAGLAFNSGTDTSFHFDSLAALGKEAEFGAREAVASRNSFLAGAIAAVAGGAVAVLDLRLAYALSAVGAVAMLVMVWRFTEPVEPAEPVDPDHEPTTSRGFVRQLASCALYMRQGSLRWLFVFALCMTVLNHIPYEFYQPYLSLLVADTRLTGEAAPMVSGLHMGITMLAASWFAARSIRLRDRIGVGPTLLTSMGLQIVIIAAMGIALHPIIAVIVLLRSAPRAIMAAPLNAAIAPKVHRRHRATYLSLQSLAGRLSFSGVLVLLSMLAGDGSIDRWLPISRMLTWTAILGCASFAVLAITLGAIRSKQAPTDSNS